jgi:hypothetical protein
MGCGVLMPRIECRSVYALRKFIKIANDGIKITKQAKKSRAVCPVLKPPKKE